VDGDAVYFDGALWQLAQANSGLTLGVGLISNATATGFDVVYVGPISGITAAYAPLTPGDYYFLSETTAGQLTSTAPTAAGTYSQPILLATSATGGLVVQYRPSQNAAATGAIAKFGNVAVVDAVNGNDGTASVNGLPFLTVNAAVTAIGGLGSPGTVWILPGTYNVTPFTIPTGCSLRGISLQTCVLQIANAAVNTTMVTMGNNTRIEDLTLLLSSSNVVNLVGVQFPGTTAQNAKVRTCVITVDNSGLAAGTTTTVYGLYLSGTNPSATNRTFSFNCIKGSTVNVLSNGGGLKCGIYQDSSSQASTRDINVYVAAPPSAASTGRYVGVETNDAAGLGQVQLRTSSVCGPAYRGVTNRVDVVVLSLDNLTLTGPATVQGITLNTGDRVLAAGQSVATQNGIWVVNATPAGAWTRAADMAVGSNANGAWTRVTKGTYAGEAWLCTAAYTPPSTTPLVTGPFVVGTNALTFQFSSQGYEAKIPVLVVATANTGRTGNPTVDGVTLVAGDRVLCTNEASAVNNGIYVVDTGGAWTRAKDLPANANPLNAHVIATTGTTYKSTAWQCSTNGTVDTSAQTWAQTYLGADILQQFPQGGNGTNGVQIGPGTDIITKSAGGKPFTTYVYPTTLVYGLNGNLQSGDGYLWPGVQSTNDTVETFYRVQQDTIAQGMAMNSRTAPAGKTCTVDVHKSWSGLQGTGVPTPLKITWTDGVLQKQNYLTSIDFAGSEYLSLYTTADNQVNNIDMTVEVDLF